MNKLILISLVLLFGSITVVGQDYIYKRKEGGRITASNITVLLDQTTYSLFGDDTGKIYSINNNEISMITFEDGNVRSR